MRIKISKIRKRCYRILSLLFFFCVLIAVICRSEDKTKIHEIEEEEILQEDAGFKELYKLPEGYEPGEVEIIQEDDEFKELYKRPEGFGPEEGEIIQKDEHFKVLYKGNFEYYYAICDSDGKIVKEGEGKQPVIDYIDSTTIRLGISAGTSVLCTTYYDTKNNRLSEVYISPVAAKYGRVAFLDYRGKDEVLIVKNIFDEDFYEEFFLDFSSMVTPVNNAEFLDKNTLYISYLSGEEHEEKDQKLKLRVN